MKSGKWIGKMTPKASAQMTVALERYRALLDSGCENDVAWRLAKNSATKTVQRPTALPVFKNRTYLRIKWTGLQKMGNKILDKTMYYGSAPVGKVIDNYGDCHLLEIDNKTINKNLLQAIKSGEISELDLELKSWTPVGKYKTKKLK